MYKKDVWTGTRTWEGWRLTTDHADSNNSQPVLVSPTGRAYGPGDIEPDKYTQSDLARILGVTRGAINDRIRRGTLPAFDFGDRWSYQRIVDIVRRHYAGIIYGRVTRFMQATTYTSHARIAANLEMINESDKFILIGLDKHWLATVFSDEEMRIINHTRVFIESYLKDENYVTRGGETSEIKQTSDFLVKYLQ